MLRRLLMAAGCVLCSVSLSGCCLFCCDSWCGNSGYAYSGGSYGSCVVPSGCPECGTGIYAARSNPVQHARAVRLERMRRHHQFAYSGRAPRAMHPQRMRGRPHCGYDGFGMDGPYGYGDGLGYDELAYGFDDGLAFDGMMADGMTSDGMMLDGGLGMNSGWMPASPCNCENGGMMGSFAGDGWIENQYVEQSPTPDASHSPAPMNQPMTEPQAMPREEMVPDPIPVTQDQYFAPLPAPGVIGSGAPTVQTTASTGVQPVLWVPNGL